MTIIVRDEECGEMNLARRQTEASTIKGKLNLGEKK